jgi:endonuclease/exonuclease/phosphatase family metal-dependent hydrolase
MERIEPLHPFGSWNQNRPIFLMGDFNCLPGTELYKVLVGNANADDPNLFKDTNKDVTRKKIDWILYKGSIKVLKYEDIDFNVNGIYPSDHKPIFVKLQIL